jgi:hypothetical protein
MEVYFQTDPESAEIHLWVDPNMCLLIVKIDGPKARPSESQNFHSLLSTGR